MHDAMTTQLLMGAAAVSSSFSYHKPLCQARGPLVAIGMVRRPGSGGGGPASLVQVQCGY